MKLFTRYNRINLLATVVIFLLSGISFYFLLRYILIGQVDDDLKIEQREIETYTGKYHRLPEIIAVRDQHISYTKAVLPAGRRSFNTVHLRDDEKEKDLVRQLTFFIDEPGGLYRVTVSKSLEGTDDLIESIVTITLITITLILAVSYLINRLVLQKLWRPFYASLAVMRNFELGKNKQPQFAVTDIDEFTIMNDTLRQAIAKAEADYHYLKEFTENASHELQTPLAIIQSKMDVLIQDEHLSEGQSRVVQGAYEAIQRLSRLNHALLLLTKIENGLYADRKAIDFPARIKEKIELFSELINAKRLNVKLELEGDGVVKMNPLLTDIILNNLLSNAIKYTDPAGIIAIVARNGLLQVSNSARNGPLGENRLFRRFASGQTTDGVGLGLAIVLQAAAVSGYTALYNYENDFHHFILVENKWP